MNTAVPAGGRVIVDMMTPRNVGETKAGRNFNRWREGRWHTIDLSSYSGVPTDIKGACFNARVQLSKGAENRHRGVQTSVYLRSPGDHRMEQMTWKARAPSGTSGVRLQGATCVAVEQGRVSFRWDARGWSPASLERPVGAMIIILFLWVR